MHPGEKNDDGFSNQFSQKKNQNNQRIDISFPSEKHYNNDYDNSYYENDDDLNEKDDD